MYVGDFCNDTTSSGCPLTCNKRRCSVMIVSELEGKLFDDEDDDNVRGARNSDSKSLL